MGDVSRCGGRATANHWALKGRGFGLLTQEELPDGADWGNDAVINAIDAARDQGGRTNYSPAAFGVSPTGAALHRRQSQTSSS